MTTAPGIVRDRFPQTDNYDSPIECHWQIKSPAPNTVVQLHIDFINLNQYRGSSNDVLLINLGALSTSTPSGWYTYNRTLSTSGSDAIGSWDFSKNATSTNVCTDNSFDPTTTYLTSGSLLSDASRNNTWLYFVGLYTDEWGAIKNLISSAQDVYLIFRSFSKYTAVPTDDIYGFSLSYTFVNSYCSGLTVITPQLDISDKDSVSSMDYLQDNAVGLAPPNLTCYWLIAPSKPDGSQFASIWVSFPSLDLHGDSYIQIYDGPSSNYSILGTFYDSNLPQSMVISSQGAIFIVYSVDGDTTAAPSNGFTLGWQAAYCPNGSGLALRAMFLKNGFARHTATMLVMVVIVVVGFTTPIAEKFLTM
ncbi:hypothetical protein AeMF1_009694 [Aphanomyces euteiches]|nr:hypothetical protein AeMF1_009694 [Aphanomyces euteiches]KAH9196952.1 hypothetical protein AeNC1_001073 [Aphanomyces euteiches]